MRLSYGGRNFYVDVGAEGPTIGAIKEGKRIAVEIQSFLSPSPVRDLQEAVGQYVIYQLLLGEQEPERVLYMAVPRGVADDFLEESFGKLIVTRLRLRILVFDHGRCEVVRWIN